MESAELVAVGAVVLVLFVAVLVGCKRHGAAAPIETERVAQPHAGGEHAGGERGVVVGLHDDEITPGVVFTTARPLDDVLSGVAPPMPERQPVMRRTSFDGEPEELLLWMPDEGRIVAEPEASSYEAPRPRLPVAAPDPSASPERREVRVRAWDTGATTLEEQWEYPIEALIDPDASGELAYFERTAAEVELATPLEIRAESHVAIPNASPAALANLLALFGLDTDPRPLRVGAHPGIRIQVYELHLDLIAALATSTDDALANLAERWEAPGPADSPAARLWALHRLRALAEQARTAGTRAYVYYDEQILG